MHLTQGGSVQGPLTSGPRGWPASQTLRPVGPTLQSLMSWLHGHALQEAVTRNLKLEAGPGGRSAKWLGWPANT
jgi:hypothetical protein